MPTALVGLVVLVVIVAGGLALRVGGTVGDGSAPSPTVTPSGGGMNLNAFDIAYYAKMAGFSGQDLAIATAIALAESSGNPIAYNPETKAKGGTPDGLGSFGLWQIYKKAHPEYASVDLFDPQINANAAYAIYLARGFQPWSTYGNNAYQAHLDVASSAAISV